jgi:hypothetical protein
VTEEIFIECPREDIADLIGIEFETVPIKRMQGTLEVAELAVKLTAAALPLLAAFLARPSRSPVGKRRVVIDGQRKVFENYSAEEVVSILQELNAKP